ncbi:MAG: response regulator [Candidatus Omnitrophica bacterium]|nr:response regulator [Candidatus Omnitrophota bacterium]
MQRILVVDDEIEVLKIIDEFLTQSGFKVEVAQDAETALEIFENKVPDLMILDMRMPGMGGEGLLREFALKKIDIPIIILTGCARIDGCPEYIKKANLKILVKPIDLSILLGMVNEGLEGWK